MTAGHRTRVLHVAPSFWPATGYGGPIFSVKALCDGLAESGEVDLRVLTTDTAPGRGRRVAVPANPMTYPAGFTVRYCRRVAMISVSPGLLARLPAMAAWAEIVHLTATYSFPTLPTLAVCRALGRPLVWSPRGGLQATAQWKDAPRRGAKAAFERACRSVMPGRTVLHVTAAMEAETSRTRIGGLDAVAIPNSIDVPAVLPSRSWHPDGRLRLMFLSRLQEKKGLEVLLDALARLSGQVTLDVYGAGEPGYVESLKRRAAENGLSSRVRFHGHVEGEEKLRAFMEADLFCLPTWSENFGIVVGEALAHGVPAITTVGAPWPGLEEHGCGLWIEHGVDPLTAGITRMQTADLAAMGQRGRGWMKRDFSTRAVVSRMLRLYRGLADGCPLGDLTS